MKPDDDGRALPLSIEWIKLLDHHEPQATDQNSATPQINGKRIARKPPFAWLEDWRDVGSSKAAYVCHNLVYLTLLFSLDWPRPLEAPRPLLAPKKRKEAKLLLYFTISSPSSPGQQMIWTGGHLDLIAFHQNESEREVPNQMNKKKEEARNHDHLFSFLPFPFVCVLTILEGRRKLRNVIHELMISPIIFLPPPQRLKTLAPKEVKGGGVDVQQQHHTIKISIYMYRECFPGHTIPSDRNEIPLSCPITY